MTRSRETTTPASNSSKPRKVQLVPVTSSNLQAVGYDAESKTLTIEFHNGSIYEYADVPPTVHNELMQAESHGKYFYKQIRNAGFKSRRVH